MDKEILSTKDKDFLKKLKKHKFAGYKDGVPDIKPGKLEKIARKAGYASRYSEKTTKKDLEVAAKKLGYTLKKKFKGGLMVKPKAAKRGY